MPQHIVSSVLGGIACSRKMLKALRRIQVLSNRLLHPIRHYRLDIHNRMQQILHHLGPSLLAYLLDLL